MSKIKPLLPTLREKKRYLAYGIITKDKVSKSISSDIVMKIKEILGVFDSADAGVLDVEFDSKTKKGILKVSTKSVDKVRTALIMINLGINGFTQIMGVSGTLKNARAKYMEG